MKEILNYISANSFYGIPLDIIAHFAIGCLIVLICKKLGFGFVSTLALVLSIAIGKEIRDDLIVGLNLMENAKDICITILPVGLAKWI